jgi:serine/threonine protein phosphatase PrpC
MTVVLRAAGRSDVGRVRTVNEDRVHVDAARGIFIVVDGVGGQAAGGRAADTAIDVLRARLERQTGAPADRVREAITDANNEIHRLASTRPEWRGMACVLTVVVLEHGRAVVGHVGDTRLYAIRGDSIEKLTPDHSPVGEREDAREITEVEAMRHPRRNEVYRDVGSDPHRLGDEDFIWLDSVPVAAGTSLLLCSDGLSDLVPSEAIRQIAAATPGDPARVVDSLVGLANDAGGRDNVSVVFIETSEMAEAAALLRPGTGAPALALAGGGPRRSRRAAGLLVFLILAALLSVFTWQGGWSDAIGMARAMRTAPAGATIVVGPGESIAAALERAQAGDQVIVEPGEYRERVTLKDGVRLTSRVPRGATLRLPGGAAEAEAAVVAAGLSGAELSGFRIVGDAATPLGVGVMVRASGVRLIDLEVTGATGAAVDIGVGDDVVLMGSEIVDNQGSAMRLAAEATPRIAHNTFARNRTGEPFHIDPAAAASWTRNVFVGVEPAAIAGTASDAAARLALQADNWFVSPPRPAGPSRGSSSRPARDR